MEIRGCLHVSVTDDKQHITVRVKLEEGDKRFQVAHIYVDRGTEKYTGHTLFPELREDEAEVV